MTAGACLMTPADHDPDERVSLAPLDAEAALIALLRVDPWSEPAEQHDNDRDDDGPAD